MSKSLASNRTQVFIDAANLLYSQKTLGWRIDYQKLKKYFEREYNLVDIHFYTAQLKGNQKQAAFLKKLQQLGYRVVAKDVKKIKLKNGNVLWKGNLDVELAIDVISNLHTFDMLILVSGDSDFSPLLDLAKAHKKRVLVVSTKGHIAKELLDRAKLMSLKHLKDDIEYK